MRWSTPADLQEQVQRLWDRGLILRSLVNGEALFPRRLTLKAPASAELADRFDEVRRWISDLQQCRHARIVTRNVQHRVIGANAVPCEAWIDSLQDALQLIGKIRQAQDFAALVALTRTQAPGVLPLLARQPLSALELARSWPLLLQVVLWVQQHPNPDIYLRQIDVPGVHSKFIETHIGVLSQMLELVLQPEPMDAPAAVGISRFCRRYGFREKPLRIRFRLLDPALALFPGSPDQDVTLDQRTFAGLAVQVTTVFITENETNFLAFPGVPDAMVIFGAGYGFEKLAMAQWLQRCVVYYWGDIDTHGFAILDQIRGILPNVRSLLMDRRTLMEHRLHWDRESKPERRDLHRLDPNERALFDDLRDDRLGSGVRLEQEKIGFSWLSRSLRTLLREHEST